MSRVSRRVTVFVKFTANLIVAAPKEAHRQVKSLFVTASRTARVRRLFVRRPSIVRQQARRSSTHQSSAQEKIRRSVKRKAACRQMRNLLRMRDVVVGNSPIADDVSGWYKLPYTDNEDSV